MERRRKKKKNNGITYRSGFFDPEKDIEIFNHMMGSDKFSSDDGDATATDSSNGGLSEDYDEQVIKIRFSSLVDDNDIAYVSIKDLRRLLNGEAEYIWICYDPEDVGGKYGDGTIKRDAIKRVYGNSQEAKMANAYIREMTKPVRESYKINEGGLSRIWQHTKDDNTFAIIGSQDKDTKEDRSDELLDKVGRLSRQRNLNIGYKPLWGRYEYEDGTIGEELSLIIFNIDKPTALKIAKALNQESIIWKDGGFFGFLTADGREDGEFSYNPKNMNFSDEDVKLFGSRLTRHKNKNQQKWFKFTMEQYKPLGERSSVRNMATQPKRIKEEVFSVIRETTTSRVFDHLKNRDWAIVSPYKYEYSEEENKQRMHLLKSLVAQMRYGFIQLLSRWVEDGVAYDEESLLIPNCTLDDAFDLGEKFEQSSIIVCKDKKCQEICVNDFENYHSGDIVRTFNLDGKNFMNINDAEEIFSKRKSGPVSKPKGKRAKAFTLTEVYIVENPRASYFQTKRTKTRIY